MRYRKIWWARKDSNLRPRDYESLHSNRLSHRPKSIVLRDAIASLHIECREATGLCRRKRSLRGAVHAPLGSPADHPWPVVRGS